MNATTTATAPASQFEIKGDVHEVTAMWEGVEKGWKPTVHKAGACFDKDLHDQERKNLTWLKRELAKGDDSNYGFCKRCVLHDPSKPKAAPKKAAPKKAETKAEAAADQAVDDLKAAPKATRKPRTRKAPATRKKAATASKAA